MTATIGRCLRCGKEVSDEENVKVSTKTRDMVFCNIHCYVEYNADWSRKIWSVGNNETVLGYNAVVPANNSGFVVRTKDGKRFFGICIIPFIDEFAVISIANKDIKRICYEDVEDISSGW